MSSFVGATSSPDPTPTQRRVAIELFGRNEARPSFDPTIGLELRAFLEAELAPLVADRQLDDALFVSKRVLAQVHSCEGLVIAEREAGFAWTPASAKGTVAHKAVELSVTLRHSPPPLDLVDLAIERLIDGDKSIRDWLLDVHPAELAELRGAAGDWVIKFQDTFPVLQRSWRPRLESPLTVDLCAGRVLLRGKVDLALGRAEGTQARVLIVDFKTGRPLPVHTDDLRFYALLETLRVGVPPYRLATFSLDSGTWMSEDVDEQVLLAAARRTVAGATRLIELGEGRQAALRAGPACRWCPVVETCDVAKAAAEG